jgi:REP element-mobilizing transposase RayT
MGMKDAFLFGEGKKSNALGYSPLDSDTKVLYAGTNVQEYRRNRNVVFACHSHVVWCPNYRRTLLVGTIETHFKQIIRHVCEELQAELEVMPDHVHLAGHYGPPVWDPSAGETHQRSFLSMLATGVPATQANIAHVVDEFLLCQHIRWCFLERHQAVY